jgi:hypothetical protein
MFPEKQEKMTKREDAEVNIGATYDLKNTSEIDQTVIEVEDKTTTRYYLSITSIRINIVIMMLCWISACFNYFMLSFLIKYFPGNIYANGLMSSTSEITGYLVSGLLYRKLGTKFTYFFVLSLATLGGLGMCYYEYTSHFFSSNPVQEAVWIFPSLVLICKFGISSFYIVNYIANFDLFPSAFAVSVLGVGCFLGSAVTVLAPEIAEMQSLTPLLTFTSLCGVTLLATCFIQKKIGEKDT